MYCTLVHQQVCQDSELLGPFSTDMLDSELGYWLTQEHCLDEDSDSDSDFEEESSSENSEQTMHPEIGLYSV